MESSPAVAGLSMPAGPALCVGGPQLGQLIAAKAVEAGRVWVNCYNLFPSGAAFGGMKASGFGREDAVESMLDFTQTKNVIVDYAPARRSFYD